MSDVEKYPVRANSGVVVGTIVRVGDEKEVGQKGHRKREIVVSTGGRYPQMIQVEFFGKNLDKLRESGADVNDDVMIAVDLKGRESGSRVFGSNDGWAIKVTRKGEPPQREPQQPAPDGFGDLPF